MIRVGLVGFGLSGRWLQAPFFAIHPAFVLKSVVTSQEIDKQTFPNTQRVADIEDLIADPELDLISICSPSSTHFDYAKRALEAGKHVLVEKPMTASYEEASELIKIAKKQQRVLSVFQNRRFDGDFMTVQRVLESGMVGQLLSYEARWHRYNPILNPKPWKEVEAPGNGIIYDLGSHLIDQAIYLFGTPLASTGKVFTQREGSAIDDAFHLVLSYEKLEVKLSASLMVKDFEPRYVIHGTEGSFTKKGLDPQEDHLRAGYLPNMQGFGEEAKENDGVLKTNLAGLEVDATIRTLKGSWLYLFENLAAAILKGEELIIKPEQVAEQIKIIQAIKTV